MLTVLWLFKCCLLLAYTFVSIIIDFYLAVFFFFLCSFVWYLTKTYTVLYIYSVDLLLQNVEDSQLPFSSHWIGTFEALHPHSLS